VRIGKITIGTLDEWPLTPGAVTTWHPTPASAAKVSTAPVSPVPVSYMQGQHLRNYSERTAAGLNFSRQIIGGCEAVGECDIAAMNQALNAYLRRHDTFRSWFEDAGDGHFIRHAIEDPDVIEFEPIDHGHLTVDEIHRAGADPDRLLVVDPRVLASYAPVSRPTNGIRASVTAGLRFFSGGVFVGATRPVDQAAPWRTLITFGQQW